MQIYEPLWKLFCHLLKKSSGNPYLKLCDLTRYFFADAPVKKKNSLHPLTALLEHPYEQNENVYI